MPINGLLADTDVLSFVAWEKPEAKAFEPPLVGELPIITSNLTHFEPMSERLGFSLVHPDRP